MSLFSIRLKELRTQSQLTQLELADKIGVNKQTISQYERGVRRPDLETLEALSDYFNVSADFMLGKANITMRYVTSDDLAILNGFNDTELKLLNTFRELNQEGREKVLDYISDLIDSGKYKKRNSSEWVADET